jgi:hypothetical protein
MASASALTRSNSSASRVGSEAMIVPTSIFLMCSHTITTTCDRALAPPGHFEKFFNLGVSANGLCYPSEGIGRPLADALICRFEGKG